MRIDDGLGHEHLGAALSATGKNEAGRCPAWRGPGGMNPTRW